MAAFWSFQLAKNWTKLGLKGRWFLSVPYLQYLTSSKRKKKTICTSSHIPFWRGYPIWKVLSKMWMMLNIRKSTLVVGGSDLAYVASWSLRRKSILPRRFFLGLVEPTEENILPMYQIYWSNEHFFIGALPAERRLTCMNFSNIPRNGMGSSMPYRLVGVWIQLQNLRHCLHVIVYFL